MTIHVSYPDIRKWFEPDKQQTEYRNGHSKVSITIREIVNDFRCCRALRRMPDPPRNRDGKNVMIMISSLSRNGAQRIAVRLAEELAGICNVYLVYEQEKKEIYPVSGQVEVIRKPPFRHDFLHLFSFYYIRMLKKKYRIDVSLSMLLGMNCKNIFSKGKERVIVSERNNPKIAYPKTFLITKLVYALADHVVFQTEEVRSLYCRYTQKHSSILPNPVSVTCQASPERKPRIVNAARLHKNKNQDMLIRAFALFLPKHPEYNLDIYGEGTEKQKLKELVDTLDLEGKVAIHDNVPDIHEQIADAGMFVLSSNTEGMSNALLEAMMMGLPCISTACTGSKEIIQNGVNGLLTEIGNTEELADAIARMADHPEQAEIMRQNAMKTAEKFQAEKVMKQWRELILG